MDDSVQSGPICLLTDFGIEDGYVGVMKGVIQSIAPGAPMIDLSHHIPPQDIRSATFLLEHSASYFPQGTVFLCVVDPGVGTERKGLAIHSEGQFFIGPDNGLLTPFLHPGEVVELVSEKHRLSNISNTFHGRDIFAPAAAYVWSGTPLSDLGPPCLDPIRLNLPIPSRVGEGWRGEIFSVDRFGNAITTFESEECLSQARDPKFRVVTEGGLEWPFTTAYARVPLGERCSLIGSYGHLELSINGGSAAHIHGLTPGASVRLVKS